MLAWSRVKARAIGTLLFVSLATLGASTALPHPDDCHHACVASLLPHDPADHSIQGPSAPDQHPLHCIICHWIRTFRPDPERASFEVPSAPDAPAVHVETFAPATSFPAAQPPLRSPPAPPALA